MKSLAIVPILPTLLDELRRKEVAYDATELAVERFSGTGSIGLLLSCKAIVQLVMNPFVGPITNRIGFNIPLSFGVATIVTSSLMFAFAESYFVLVAARALHGFGSAFTNVAGCGLVALKFREDKERSSAMSIALAGLALGDLLGPALGGFMNQYVNRSSPFLAIAIVALLNGFCQWSTLGLTIEKPKEEPKSLTTLLMDPYIIIVALALALANGGIGMLETALPNWMMRTMGSSVWEQAVAYLPCSFFYLVGAYCCSRLGDVLGRWITIAAGLFLIGLSTVLATLSRNFYEVLLPTSVLGLAVGLVDSCALPELGRLVDLRHTSVYGNVYVIGDIFPSLGYGITSAVCGVLVDVVGFNQVMYSTGIVIVLYAPILLFLKKTTISVKGVVTPTETASLPTISMRKTCQVTKL